MTDITNQVDLGGNNLIVNKILTGATAPGQAGTELTSTNLAALTGVVAGTVSASKAVVVDANSDIAGLDVVGIARIDWDSATATLSSNAATITKWTAVVTTESLSTAHTATQALVITKTGVASGDIAVATLAGGTNTGGVPIIQKVICTTNTVTITLWNAATATNAFNGTFIINLLITKA